MKIKYLIIPVLLIFFVVNSCKDSSSNKEYIQSVKEWRKERLKGLKSEKGWLNLRGLFWLKNGKNTFGSDSSNIIVFPEKAPDFMGNFILNDSLITFHSDNNIQIMHEGSVVKKTIMRTDQTEHPTVLQHGSLKWFVIERNGEYAIRLRDLKSPLLSELDSIPAYPVKPEWKIKATFKEYEQDKYIEVPNVLGESYQEKIPGILSFSVNNQTYYLSPLGTRENLFLIFGDETNAETTYGGGRFLSVGKPDEDNNVYIDFNKAYNPPCAFTPYATCPLPPRENILPVKIEAGEKAPDLPVDHH